MSYSNPVGSYNNPYGAYYNPDLYQAAASAADDQSAQAAPFYYQDADGSMVAYYPVDGDASAGVYYVSEADAIAVENPWNNVNFEALSQTPASVAIPLWQDAVEKLNKMLEASFTITDKHGKQNLPVNLPDFFHALAQKFNSVPLISGSWVASSFQLVKSSLLLKYINPIAIYVDFDPTTEDPDQIAAKISNSIEARARTLRKEIEEVVQDFFSIAFPQENVPELMKIWQMYFIPRELVNQEINFEEGIQGDRLSVVQIGNNMEIISTFEVIMFDTYSQTEFIIPGISPGSKYSTDIVKIDLKEFFENECVFSESISLLTSPDNQRSLILNATILTLTENAPTEARFHEWLKLLGSENKLPKDIRNQLLVKFMRAYPAHFCKMVWEHIGASKCERLSAVVLLSNLFSCIDDLLSSEADLEMVMTAQRFKNDLKTNWGAEFFALFNTGCQEFLQRNPGCLPFFIEYYKSFLILARNEYPSALPLQEPENPAVFFINIITQCQKILAAGPGTFLDFHHKAILQSSSTAKQSNDVELLATIIQSMKSTLLKKDPQGLHIFNLYVYLNAPFCHQPLTDAPVELDHEHITLATNLIRLHGIERSPLEIRTMISTLLPFSSPLSDFLCIRLIETLPEAGIPDASLFFKLIPRALSLTQNKQIVLDCIQRTISQFSLASEDIMELFKEPLMSTQEAADKLVHYFASRSKDLAFALWTHFDTAKLWDTQTSLKCANIILGTQDASRTASIQDFLFIDHINRHLENNPIEGIKKLSEESFTLKAHISFPTNQYLLSTLVFNAVEQIKTIEDLRIVTVFMSQLIPPSTTSLQLLQANAYSQIFKKCVELIQGDNAAFIINVLLALFEFSASRSLLNPVFIKEQTESLHDFLKICAYNPELAYSIVNILHRVGYQPTNDKLPINDVIFSMCEFTLIQGLRHQNILLMQDGVFVFLIKYLPDGDKKLQFILNYVQTLLETDDFKLIRRAGKILPKIAMNCLKSPVKTINGNFFRFYFSTLSRFFEKFSNFSTEAEMSQGPSEQAYQFFKDGVEQTLNISRVIAGNERARKLLGSKVLSYITKAISQWNHLPAKDATLELAKKLINLIDFAVKMLDAPPTLMGQFVTGCFKSEDPKVTEFAKAQMRRYR